jgi:phospho-N-acetylmuramoyl-pentapeptide-transferase
MIALILSLIISTVYGKKIIQFLQKRQLGESVRDLGLAGEQMKKGTPTMGGIIIILAIIIPTLLLADLHKVYIRLMLLCTVWLGAIGFIDDYLKIRAKRIAKEKGVDYKKSDADGLAGRFKIFGQVMLGIIVGAALYFNPNVVVKREVIPTQNVVANPDKNVKFDTDFQEGDVPMRNLEERSAALDAKFTQNMDLRKILAETKKAKLVHFVRSVPPIMDEALMKVRAKIVSNFE